MEALKLLPRGDEKPKALRAEGMVPIGYVVSGEPTRKMQAPEAEVRKALLAVHGGGILKIQFDGETKRRSAVIKHVEDSIVGRHIENVVLKEIDMREELVLDVPISPVGVPEPVAEGAGNLVHPTGHIKIRGKASDLPTAVTVDVSHLQIGGHINAGDLILPEGMELASSADATLFSVQPIRAVSLEPETAEAASAEPELVADDAGDSAERND